MASSVDPNGMVHNGSPGSTLFAVVISVIYTGLKLPGPSCSKLTTPLVNDSLKFTWSESQIC